MVRDHQGQAYRSTLSAPSVIERGQTQKGGVGDMNDIGLEGR